MGGVGKNRTLCTGKRPPIPWFLTRQYPSRPLIRPLCRGGTYAALLNLSLQLWGCDIHSSGHSCYPLVLQGSQRPEASKDASDGPSAALPAIACSGRRESFPPGSGWPQPALQSASIMLGWSKVKALERSTYYHPVCAFMASGCWILTDGFGLRERLFWSSISALQP